MKASKIIKLLQERNKVYGDVEVIYTYDNIGVDIGKETSYYFYSNDDNDVETYLRTKKMKYPKINTLWKRDDKGYIIEGDYSEQYFPMLNSNWLALEKIDGTNIRVYWDGTALSIEGRTEKTDKTCDSFIEIEAFIRSKIEGKMSDMFGDKNVIIYGEGLHPKVNEVCAKVKGDINFVIFDIVIGRNWFNRQAVEGISKELGLDCVNRIDIEGKEINIIDYVKSKPLSTYYRNKGFDIASEGIVCITDPLVYDRHNNPIKFKLKTSDYKKLRNKNDISKNKDMMSL